MEYLLYTHTRPDTGSVFYVGIGKGDRPYHKWKRSRLWNNIVSKNNGDYIITIVHSNISKEEAIRLEKEYIKLYGRIDLKTGTLCNHTNGGDGIEGYSHTQETKDYIAYTSSIRKQRPESIAKRVAKQLGQKRTDEQRKRMSDAHKGKPLTRDQIENRKKTFWSKSEEERKAIYAKRRPLVGPANPNFRGYILQLHPETGDVINRFDSIASIEKHFKVSQRKVYELLKNPDMIYYGRNGKNFGIRLIWESK